MLISAEKLDILTLESVFIKMSQKITTTKEVVVFFYFILRGCLAYFYCRGTLVTQVAHFYRLFTLLLKSKFVKIQPCFQRGHLRV